MALRAIDAIRRSYHGVREVGANPVPFIRLPARSKSVLPNPQQAGAAGVKSESFIGDAFHESTHWNLRDTMRGVGIKKEFILGCSALTIVLAMVGTKDHAFRQLLSKMITLGCFGVFFQTTISISLLDLRVQCLVRLSKARLTSISTASMQ